MKEGNTNRIEVLPSNNDGPEKEYRFSLEFFVFQENGVQIAYCPSLDISTSGKTFNEAVGNFYEMFQLYIECCVENNTLHESWHDSPGHCPNPCRSRPRVCPSQ